MGPPAIQNLASEEKVVYYTKVYFLVFRKRGLLGAEMGRQFRYGPALIVLMGQYVIDQGGSAVDAHFAVDVLKMFFDRYFADEQFFCNFHILEP